VSRTTARRVVVHGHVQGVFYRQSTVREAQRRGVAGWVANRADGSVAAHFEGEPAAVEALVAFAAHGPRGAQVARFEVTETPVEGLSGFVVRG